MVYVRIFKKIISVEELLKQGLSFASILKPSKSDILNLRVDTLTLGTSDRGIKYGFASLSNQTIHENQMVQTRNSTVQNF